MNGQLLSQTSPHLWSEAIRYPGGLRVLPRPFPESPILVVKAPHQYLLTARMNRGFSIYVAPAEFEEGSTIGIMSAFFDDADEPLTIWTPLFDEPASHLFVQTLLQRSAMEVRMVDEHDREFLGYTATLSLSLRSQLRLEHTPLLEISHAFAKAAQQAATIWFAIRGKEDDIEAIKVEFTASLYPEDRSFKDERPDLYRFHGGKGAAEVPLVKLEPGHFQELDIILLLQRVFEPEQIYHSPLRVYDEEEIGDAIVVTDEVCLIVQAKDSPNTELMLKNTIARKRAKAKSQLKEGGDQVSGAIGYLERVQPLRFFIGKGAARQEVTIDLGRRNILSLVVVRETFLEDYAEYTKTLLKLFDDIKLPCIGLSYMELIQYCTFCQTPDAFFNAYFQVFDCAMEHGEFPRLRFGVNDLFDTEGNFKFD